MLFMVVEHFRPGRATEVYRRFRDRGRMAPDGLRYISSCLRPRVILNVRRTKPLLGKGDAVGLRNRRQQLLRHSDRTTAGCFATVGLHVGPLTLALLMTAAPATAGQGWYLIYPPLKLNVSDAAWERIKRELDKEPNGSAEVIATWWLDLKLPPNRWVKRTAYDSRRDCEEALRSVKRTGRGPEGEALGGLGRALFSHAICLSADDPRLACESWNVMCVPP